MRIKSPLPEQRDLIGFPVPPAGGPRPAGFVDETGPTAYIFARADRFSKVA